MNCLLDRAASVFREIRQSAYRAPILVRIDVDCLVSGDLEFVARFVDFPMQKRWRVSRDELATDGYVFIGTDFEDIRQRLERLWLETEPRHAVEQQIQIVDHAMADVFDALVGSMDLYGRELSRLLHERADPGPSFLDFVVRRNDTAAAHHKGLALLKEWLSPQQRAQFDAHTFFDVIGSATKNRYRITFDSVMNVEQLDDTNKIVEVFCFTPVGHLCTPDILLAQKIALETDETAALKVANKRSDSPMRLLGPRMFDHDSVVWARLDGFT